MAKIWKPKSVRELLTEMKDVSDLMIDLAYASLLFEDDEIAERVHELEARMDELMYSIRIIAAVAARNVREARKITGILQVASAAEAISNATGDMADLVLRGIDIHPVVREAIANADEKVAKIEVADGSMLLGKRFSELRLPSNIGVWVLAIKRDKSWIVPPTRDAEASAGDVLIARGPQDGINTLSKMAAAPKMALVPKQGLASIRDALAEMRDLSSVMVDMAYSSILLGSREIAEWVRELEEEFDKLNYKLWLATLRAAKRERDVARLNSVLQVVKCMEKISDAADSIVDVVLRGVELHPVFARAIAEADERIAKVDVSEGSPLVSKTLGKLNLWATMGAYVLMIKRGKCYIFDPSMKVRVRAGDSLIVRGSYFGVEKLKEAAGVKAPPA
ncbi:MAG: TrkA C-terminal domain-containing protein [Candidatus Hodarchaeaceae archaeon]|nr:TrkA C-terminal domain-containing protein [Candidatus Hodarchaeaceae archaeon]